MQAPTGTTVPLSAICWSMYSGIITMFGPAVLPALDVLVDRLLVAALVLQAHPHPVLAGVVLVGELGQRLLGLGAECRARTAARSGRRRRRAHRRGTAGATSSGVVVVVGGGRRRRAVSSAAASRPGGAVATGRPWSSSPRVVVGSLPALRIDSPDAHAASERGRGRQRRVSRRAGGCAPAGRPSCAPRYSRQLARRDSLRSSLHRAGGEAADELALEHQEHDDDRQRRRSARPAITRLGRSSSVWASWRSPLWTVFMSRLGRDQVRPQVLVERRQEAEQRHRPDRRADQRHGDVAEEAEVADAVDLGRVAQVAGQASGTPGAAGTSRTRWRGTARSGPGTSSASRASRRCGG